MEQLGVIRKPDVGNYDGLSYPVLSFEAEIMQGGALILLQLKNEDAQRMLGKVGSLRQLAGKSIIVDVSDDRAMVKFVRENF